MSQKITKKLTATLVATATAFTLLFMAQPAQASVGAPLTVVFATANGDVIKTVTIPNAAHRGFDIVGCLQGALSEIVGIDLTDAAKAGIGASVLKSAGKVLRIVLRGLSVFSYLTAIPTIIKIIFSCIKGGMPKEEPRPTSPPYIPTPYDDCIAYDQTHISGPRCQRR